MTRETQERLAPELDRVFKFKIGDLVQFRSGRNSRWNNKTQFQRIDWQLVVIERMVQECPGGIQLQYRVRDVVNPVAHLWLNEVEIAKPE